MRAPVDSDFALDGDLRIVDGLTVLRDALLRRLRPAALPRYYSRSEVRRMVESMLYWGKRQEMQHREAYGSTLRDLLGPVASTLVDDVTDAVMQALAEEEAP